jgi:hypothetical protein
MKRLSLVITAGLLLAAAASAVRADSVTVSQGNASLKFSTDTPGANIGQPSDPVKLPRTVEWTVDGRRILVYPSGPWTFVDVSHLHGDAHVNGNQLHAQGPMLGFASTATSGTVTGGAVYSVTGGAAGSGFSRISEKVDIHNKTAGAVTVHWGGMGYKPTQASLEVPDLSGLDVQGVTVAFFQGNATASGFTDPPYPPLTVLPTVRFSGFNPKVSERLDLPAGATLTVITELTVGEPVQFQLATWTIAILLVVLSVAGAAAAIRRRAARRA